MSRFLSEESEDSQIISSITRFTETRKVSSKINAVLTCLMVDYANILIHHLLRAGNDIWTTLYGGGNRHINLVSFKVSDLMRSKLQCS